MSEPTPPPAVQEFWGRPSDGTFRKVAVVSDFFKQVEQANFAVDIETAEKRVAQALATNCECTFPVTRDPCGRYGAWDTPEGLERIVHRSLKALRPVADTFDCLMVTGLSGSVPGAVVAYIMHKQLLILRKQDEHGSTLSHGKLVEGESGLRTVRIMLYDDFVSGAGTLRRLMKYVPARGGSRIVGVCLYGHPLAAEEREKGIAKMFSVYHDGEYKDPTNYNLVRREPTSLLFDIIKVDRVCSSPASPSSPPAS